MNDDEHSTTEENSRIPGCYILQGNLNEDGSIIREFEFESLTWYIVDLVYSSTIKAFYYRSLVVIRKGDETRVGLYCNLNDAQLVRANAKLTLNNAATTTTMLIMTAQFDSCSWPINLLDQFSLQLQLTNFRLLSCDEHAVSKELSNQGRPTSYDLYVNDQQGRITRWRHRHNISGKLLSKTNYLISALGAAYQELIDLLKQPDFNETDIAPTVYLADRCDDELLQRIPTREYTFKGDSKKLLYHHPFDILKFIMAHKTFEKNWVEKSSTKENHASAYEGWQEYENEFREELATCSALLLLFNLWVDGFDAIRKQSFCSIYISLANFGVEVKITARNVELKLLHLQDSQLSDSRFDIITLGKDYVDRKMEFIDDVLVTFFHDLEEKNVAPIEYKGRLVLPVGGLHMVKSDHPGRCELAGVVGAGGNFPSFYTTAPKWEFKNLDYEFRKNREPKMRKFSQSLQIAINVHRRGYNR